MERLMSYNKKHNKIKNTGILFELLTRQITADVLNGKNSKAVNILKKVLESIKLHYDLFYNFSFEKTENFIELRNEVIDSIKKQSKKLSNDDVRILVMVEHILEVLRNTYSSKMAMQY